MAIKTFIFLRLKEIWHLFLDIISSKPSQPVRRQGMKYVPVLSSSIEAIGYDEDTNMLSILFLRDKSVYFYAGVPQEIYNNFLTAESKGTYLNQAIKGAYAYFKLEDVEIFPVGTKSILNVIRTEAEKIVG